MSIKSEYLIQVFFQSINYLEKLKIHFQDNKIYIKIIHIFILHLKMEKARDLVVRILRTVTDFDLI